MRVVSYSPNLSKLSKREKLKTLPKDKREALIAGLSDEDCFALLYDWDFNKRLNQGEPGEPYDVWTVMAGRGFGKTRVGAEQVRKWVKTNPIVNLIGPTSADLRDVMVKGTGAGSSIMEICPPNERPIYEPSKRLLSWPNGAKSVLFSAEEPERLRGPQCCKLWCDELPAWQYQKEAWDQANFGLRLGNNPQCIITTTPKPTKTLKEILKDPGTIITTGTTEDNASNLASKFLRNIKRKYEGTRLGQQELLGLLLEDNPKALWKMDQLDQLRRDRMPSLRRIVIAIDPAVSAKADSDETGIMVAGQDHDNPSHYYVFEDISGIYTPKGWADAVNSAFQRHQADRVVAEVNNGGDLVEANLRASAGLIPYRSVHATKGKTRRAEPVAALYEQGLVHHVGNLAKLESEMTNWDASIPDDQQDSPNRMDALVWCLWELAGLGGDDEEGIETGQIQMIQISQGLDEDVY